LLAYQRRRRRFGRTDEQLTSGSISLSAAADGPQS
jgi:hypothetical protein